RQENKPSVKPLDEFGVNFEGFKGKEAVDKLLSEKRGQVKGAFYKEGLGEIDLVWGDSKKGLSHILERRKEDFIKQGLDENEALERALEFVKKIPQIIEQGEVKVGVNRAFVDTKDDRALIALDYKGKDKKWVITAYKMDDPSQADTHLTRLNTSTSSVSRASVVNESIAENEAKKSLFESSENFYDYEKKLLREISIEGLDKQNAKDKLYFNTIQTYMEKLGNFEKELSNIVQEVRPFLRLNQKHKIIDKLYSQRDKKDFRNSLKELVYFYVHKDKLGIDDIHKVTMDYVESMAKYVKGLLPYDNHPSFEKLVKE
ncbi:hypothetical protein ACV9QR_001680, partial [Campylobacter upsaliensis]